MSKLNIKRILIIIFIVLAIIIIKYNMSNSYKKTSVSLNSTVENTGEYLKKLENQEVRKVEMEINKKHGREINDFDITKAAKHYENTVFMGDSITEYLSALNILADSSVIAHKGDTVIKAASKVDILKNMQPENIIILYGMNDISSFNADVFEKKYIELVNLVKKQAPKSQIYLVEPLQVDDAMVKARGGNISNESLEPYRLATKNVAQNTKVKYIPTQNLIYDRSLYEKDGIHLKYDFYKKYLAYLSSNLEY